MKSITCIVGGGIAGLSLASFLDSPAVVLEKADRVGGLSRSYNMNGVAYDIGPHIIFSKNKTVLDLHTSMIQTAEIRRSNQIFYKGRYIKYPFENDLAALDPAERDYCLNEFLNNPYQHYKHQNMLQFFLKTFGEGITKTYLQPYNEKIWKFDPAMMDVQMVERIPKPPAEDVIKSAKGVKTEGYTHQLYFHYPQKGGFQSLVDKYRCQAEKMGHTIATGVQIESLKRSGHAWRICTNKGVFETGRLVNCSPVHEFMKYLEPPASVKNALEKMLYNSIHIVMVQVRKDLIGNHFALYLPEKDVIFHRLSKLNFLGDAYKLKNDGSTLMAEVTFRPNSHLSTLSVEQVKDSVIEGLERCNFIDRRDVLDVEVKTEKYAYVIYDLDHRSNVNTVLDWLLENEIHSSGRFAEFEYLNTDGVVERTMALAKRLSTTSCNVAASAAP